MSFMQWFLSWSGIIPSTIVHDRISNVTRDMCTLRYTVRTLTVISALSWIGIRYPSTVNVPFKSQGPLESATSGRRVEEIVFHCSSLLWITYLFSDLIKAGMLRHKLCTLLLLVGISSATIGPVATVASAWSWREETLATKRHHAAITAPENFSLAENFVAKSDNPEAGAD
jgi:hypothetical protein